MDELMKESVLNVDVRTYRSEPMCMSLLLRQEGVLDMYRYPITMNLGNYIAPGRRMPKYAAYLDVNNANYEQLKTVIEQNGIGKPYMRNGKPVVSKSGFSEYPLYQFSAEKLREIDPKGCAKYEQGYGVGAYVTQMSDEIKSRVHAAENEMDL